MSARVVLIGGPYDGQRADLSRNPKRIGIGKAGHPRQHEYERVDDPETGDFLGGYVYSPPTVDVWDVTGYSGAFVGSTEAVE